jgi:hypothetical protein
VAAYSAPAPPCIPRPSWRCRSCCATVSKRAERALTEARSLEATIPDALEIAWRELPPPRTDVVQMGQNDLGALRGFYAAEDGRRWTRPRAWVRLLPVSEARTLAITLLVGAPPHPGSRPI